MKRARHGLLLLIALFCTGCAARDVLWSLYGDHYTGDRPVDPAKYQQDTPETRQLRGEEDNLRRCDDGAPFDGNGIFLSGNN
jgi:hypothetical protein